MPELCPYVGLQPFTEEDRAYFFGREREIRLVGANLYAAKLTVLYGESGVGKSSLLMAGVVPGLRKKPRTAVALFRDWQRSDALAALKAGVAHAADEAAGKSLGLDAAAPLDDLLAAAAQAIGGTVLVLLDQFEEYFLYFPPGGAGETFDAELARAVNRRDVNAGFVLSIREDSLSKLDRFRARIPTVLANPLRIGHLRSADARLAITKPLEVYNEARGAGAPPVTAEAALVDAVVEQTRSGRVALGRGAGTAAGATDAGDRVEAPYLQLVLTRLWERERAAGSSALRAQTLADLGGAATIVRTHLDQVMTELSPSDRALCATFFDRLVTPSGTKIACRLDDLQRWAGAEHAAGIERVVRHLAGPRARVLRTIDPLPGEPPKFEIFHDVLAAGVIEWQARFAERSRARQQRTRYAITGTVALLSLATAAVAVWAWSQAREAERESRGREYAASAMLSRGFDPPGALGTARLASLFSSHSSVEAALRHSIAALNERDRVALPPDRHVVAADLARDGRSVAIALDDGTVEARALPSLAVLWQHKVSAPRAADLIYLDAPGVVLLTAQTRAGLRVTRLEAGGGVTAVLPLPAEGMWADPGSAVAIRRLRDRTVATDLVTGTDTAVQSCPGAIVLETAHRGGRLLVAQWLAAPAARAILICDGATGRELARVPVGERFPGRAPNTAMFSGDGRLLALQDIMEEEIHVWDWEQGRATTLRDFSAVPGMPRFGPDLTAVVPVFDGTIELWRLSTLHREAEKRTQRNERVLRLPGRPGAVLAAPIAGDGVSVLSVEAGAIRLWQGIAPAARAAVLPAPAAAGAFGPGGVPWVVLTDGRFGAVGPDGGFADAVPAPAGEELVRIAVNHQGTLALVAWKSGLLSVENLIGGKRQRSLRIAGGILAADWVSHCCRFAAQTPDGVVQVFDVAQEEAIATLRLPASARTGRLAPDLRHWVRADGSVIDVGTGAELRRLAGKARGIGWPFLGEDHVLTIEDFGVARIEPLAAEGAVVELAGHAAAVRAAAVTSDGRIVVTGGDDWHAVRWLAAGAGERLARFSGHVGPIREIAIDWWSDRVATVGEDATARVWDPDSGTQLARLPLAPGPHKLLAFDGVRLLLGAPERGLIVLECEPCRPFEALKALAEARGARLRDSPRPAPAGASQPAR